MDLNNRVVTLLLDKNQSALTRLARKVENTITKRVPCPGCGSTGPHQDNGARLAIDLSYCCNGCGEHFDAAEV